MTLRHNKEEKVSRETFPTTQVAVDVQRPLHVGVLHYG